MHPQKNISYLLPNMVLPFDAIVKKISGDRLNAMFSKRSVIIFVHKLHMVFLTKKNKVNLLVIL